MADGLLPLNPATIPGGQSEDIETLVGAGGAPAIRQRLQVVGNILIEIARVINADPTGSEFALVTRNILAEAATSTVTRVAVALGNTPLLIPNAARRQAIFFNESPATGRLFLKLGAGASAISYTIILVPGAAYELPQPIWTGEIDGIWDALGGAVQITEIT